LVNDGDQNQRYSAPNKCDHLFTIVPDGGSIVLNGCVSIEELVALAKDPDSDKQKNNKRAGESSAQSRDAGVFNHCQH
jgi:hypothetical protein